MRQLPLLPLFASVALVASTAFSLNALAGSAPAKASAINSSARGAASSAPRREGSSFVFSDGTRVRATDPSGHAGTVGRDGSISYGDGTRVTHDPSTGESKILHPDGSSTRANPNDPRRDGGNYVYGDGVRVRAVDPSGKEGQVQGNGSIRYSDGTSLSHDVRSGDTKIVHPDGSVEVTTANTPHQDGGNFVWSDGQRARATDPSGATGKVQADGSIAYSDGSRVSHDVHSGDSKIVHADGSVEMVPGNVPRQNGDSFQWSDGVHAPAHDPSGNPGSVGGDGWISYSDGTTVSHDPLSGDSKIVHPDGTMTMGNSRTGETKSYDPAQERGLTAPGSSQGKGSAQNTPGAQNGRTPQNTSSSTQNNNNSSSNQNSNSNNSNSNNSNSEKAKTEKTEKSPAPEKEKPEKSGKGRMVQDDSPSGIAKGGQRFVGVDLTGQPAPDESHGKGSPKPGLIRGGVGPGGRPFGEKSSGGSRVPFTTHDLVVNPNPVALAGSRSARPPIDASGGRR